MVEHALRTVGMDLEVPLLDGSRRRYVNLDNAASTPPLVEVQEAVERFLPWYSSVHRGSGFKSQLATEALEEARRLLLRFVGADPQSHAAIFTTNTTEALNRLAQLYHFQPGDVVLISGMEHHANDLPWRAHARVDFAEVTPEGRFDLAALERKLAEHAGRVRLVSVTGASNVTGFVTPIHQVARLAHAHGAKVVVDAAQLAPHRPISIAHPDQEASIDFLVLSGHKLYAPYGAGALVGPIEFMERVEPDRWGGGAVRIVSHEEVYLLESPDRLEPGSPNTVGIVALGAAMQALMAHGMDRVDRHERELTAYALERMRDVPGIRLFGSADPAEVEERVGVIPFMLGDLPHGLVAAILAQEGGIGVRNGCFCAHPYVLRLLQVEEERFIQVRDQALRGMKVEVPGLVRVSFGCYSTAGDVDALVEMLHRIARGEYRSGYQLNPATGEYSHPEYQPDFRACFAL
ncbi:MAG: aminotransferase class V-fold PLP-dependent enzyme [Bacillota bacterium]